MKILVTGGKGYLGGRLCQFFASSDDYQVFCGTRNFVSLQESGIEERMTDWSSQESLLLCCRGIDVIVHLAGMNAADCDKDPVAALMLNGIGTAQLLEAAKTEGVKRFIYISTAHVYGSPLMGHITEDTFPFPIHPYATSHKTAEDLVLALRGTGSGLEGVVLRLSNAYGVPVRMEVNCWGLLFNDLCRQAVTQETIILRSSGMQRRDFVPITDVCRAIAHLLTLPIEKFNKPIFNIGGNWSPTVLEIASIIADRIELKIGYRPIIKRATPSLEERPTHLTYCINRLLGTGFILNANRMNELDDLIHFCCSAFE